MPGAFAHRMGALLFTLFLITGSVRAADKPDYIFAKLNPESVIGSAGTIEALIAQSKPAIVCNRVDMLWVDTDENGGIRFTLARAQWLSNGKQKPAWFILKESPRATDLLPPEVDEDFELPYVYARVGISAKVPVHDAGALEKIGHIDWAVDYGHEFQFVDTLADWYAGLVGIYHPREQIARSLPLSGYRKKILILSKQDASKFSRSVEQERVIKRIAPIFLCRDNVNSARTQAIRNGLVDVFVHQQA